jgi:Protein of unknown function (DUF3261)
MRMGIQPCAMKMLLFAVAVAITACATHANLRPLTPEEQARALTTCLTPYPKTAFSAVHRLSFTFSDNRHVSFIGVTAADQGHDRLRSVLLSPEGMGMFDAVYEKGEIQVRQWMLPGDAAIFASALFEDVRLMFLPPPWDKSAMALQQNGQTICRFRSQNMVTDVVPSQDGTGYELRRADLNEKPRKVLLMHGPFTHGFAKIMTLASSVEPAYSLVLELLEEEPLAISDDLFSCSDR